MTVYRRRLATSCRALRNTLRRRPKGGVVHHSDQGSQGEFKRSSQHLREMLRWQRAGTEERIEPYVHGCVHQAVRRWDAASIGRGSGKRSLEVCRARRPPWQRVCPLLSGHAGFANVVACHHSIFVPSHGAISRSLSEKRSPFFEPVGRGVREIARQLGRSPSTISRGLRLHRGLLQHAGCTRRWATTRRRTSRDSTMRPEANPQRRGGGSAPDLSGPLASSRSHVASLQRWREVGRDHVRHRQPQESTVRENGAGPLGAGYGRKEVT